MAGQTIHPSELAKRVQNLRCPNGAMLTVPIASSPEVKTRSCVGTDEKTNAGAPEIRRQIVQWHQPVSNGWLSSR